MNRLVSRIGFVVALSLVFGLVASEASGEWISRGAKVEVSSSSRWNKYPAELVTQKTPISKFIWAFHTDQEQNPWAIITLPKPGAIAAFEIINRIQDDVNNWRNLARDLTMWVSDDKKAWKQVWQTKKGQDVWAVNLDKPVKARYIKLGLPGKLGRRYFHLKSVKLFDAKIDTKANVVDTKGKGLPGWPSFSDSGSVGGNRRRRRAPADPPVEAPATLKFAEMRKSESVLDFDKIVFVKRITYTANHYYTEFINSRWLPGGNLCVLDMKTGKVTDIVKQLKGGVFGRFDLSYDAKKLVFAWKKAHQEGYRIYEVNIDGTGLRQITFPQKNEAELVKLYRARPHYHHGTDDMHPCYMPDGKICFISTRCQYGILCDSPDDFTTTVLYKIDADGKNMIKLSNSSVSEQAPVMMPDGRILYTRWEYWTKGAVSVKCLWAMRPDGSGSAEIYAADISLPPTFIYGRPIPETENKYVVMGTPHCPQNGIGTIIRLDMRKNIRTRDPMTYMTPYTDIQAEGGFSFKTKEGHWRRDGRGNGPLFKDPYPLSEKLFLVSHKPNGSGWTDPTGYGLYILDEEGNVGLIHKEDDISCWLPYPLKARKKPPVLITDFDQKTAKKNLATCVVTDIYHGMEETRRGTIKYIRVMEQIPRPWATRRRWGGDAYDQQHACITKDTHLGLKVQHGVVPVEADGSAHFVVPANANIAFHALDENYMAVQIERTYVNYMPGETRACIGCHETPNDAAAAKSGGAVMALKRPASVPGPQIGEKSGQRPLHYASDVQPVLDKHCVKCHSGEKPKADLVLTGEMTRMFSVSYESLLKERRRGKGRRRFELFPTVGENHPKTGNVHYEGTRSYGSHNSILVAMHSKGKVKLKDPKKAEIVAKLAKVHEKVNLKPEELLKISNWVDTNAQYYGAYWGRKNLQYKDHPNFRPVPSFKDASSYVSPIPEDKR